MKRIKALAVAVLIALALIAFLLAYLGPTRILETLEKADLRFLALALAVQVLDMIVLAKRWQVFLSAIPKQVKFLDCLLATISGVAVNNLTPATRAGGEPLRVYLIKKKKRITYSAGFASIVAEKLVDMSAFLLIALVSILYAILFLHLPLYIIILLVAFSLFSLSLLLLLWYYAVKRRLGKERIDRWLARIGWLTKRIPVVERYIREMEDSISDYYKDVNMILSEKSKLFVGFFLSLVYWTLEMSRAYLIFLALGINAPFPVIALAYIFSATVGALPLSVGGVGLVEGTMIIIYSTSSINTVIASVETILDRILSYWLVILVGLPLAGFLGLKEEDENGRLHDSPSKGSKTRKVRNH